MDNRPIGVMDSGIGGLTVVHSILELCPRESILYLGDTARNPYGEKADSWIMKCGEELKNFLIARGVKMVVVACNTITFHEPPLFYQDTVPVIGMSTDYSSAGAARKVGIFATPASIRTHAHKKALQSVWPDMETAEVPCEGLAHAIESGEGRAVLKNMLEEAVYQYDAGDIDMILFGCTHYPLIEDLFRELFPSAVFFDPGAVTAERASGILKTCHMEADGDGESHFCFTKKSEQESCLIKKFLHRKEKAEEIRIAGE